MFGLEVQNEAGKRLTELCQENVLASSPPLAQGLDEAGIALGSSQVQKAHAPERASMGQTLRTPPGGAWDHVLYQDHHPGLEPRTLAFILWCTHPQADT